MGSERDGEMKRGKKWINSQSEFIWDLDADEIAAIAYEAGFGDGKRYFENKKAKASRAKSDNVNAPKGVRKR